ETAREELLSFLQENKNIVIDGSALSYVDSSGLGLFLEINNELKQRGLKSLVFANLTFVVRKSLEVTHLAQIMPIYNSEVEAAAGFTLLLETRLHHLFKQATKHRAETEL
ncbi:MAG: STAS domain-containing protein, partial [Promethearchaeota archaeon]